MLINNIEGYAEAVLDANCDNSLFYEAGNILENVFRIEFTSKLDDFDTFYWDFNYEGAELTLHYNIYLGLSIFPKALKSASENDNQKVAAIGRLLFYELQQKK